MTTLGRMVQPGGATPEHPGVPGSARLLLLRLHEECDRQVPFSQAKLLLREAASAIERLEADLARTTAELAAEREARPAR